MSQQLMIRFGADTSAAVRAMTELTTTVLTSAVTMGVSLKGQAEAVQSLSTKLGGLPNIVRLAVGGFVAFEAVSFVLKGVSDAADAAMQRLAGVVKLANDARAAGVSTQFFQAVTGQADVLGVKPDMVQGALRNAREAMTDRISEGDQTRVSPAVGRLTQNVSAGNLRQGDLDRYNAAPDQEGRYRVILELLQRLQEEGRKLAAFDLAKTVFGSEFEAKFREGNAIIDTFTRSLDALKNGQLASGGTRILSPEEVATAERLNQQLQIAKQALADSIAPIQRDIAQYEQQQLEALQQFEIHILNAASAFAKLYAHVKAVGDAITAIGNSNIFNTVYDWFNRNGMGGMNGVVDLTDADRKAAKETINLPAITVTGDKSKSLPSLTPKKAKESSSSEVDPIENLINNLEKSTSALKAETENFYKSNAEKRVAIELAKAEEVAKAKGVTLTEQQTSRIKAAATATAEYKDKLADLEQQQRQSADTARHFGETLATALGDAISGGAKLSDILKNVMSQLGRQSLSAIITGSGPLAGLFGTAPKASDGAAVGGLFGLAKGLFPSLGGGGALQGPTQSGATLDAATGGGGIGGFFSSIFGGFRANGGPVEPGRVYRINELGQELFAPGVSGTMIPANRAGLMGAGDGGGAMAYSPTWNLNAPGAGPEIIATVKGMIAAHDAEINRTLPQRVSRAQRRFT